MGDLEGKRDFNFTDIRGFKIMSTTGHKVGTVKDVFVDPNTLEPRFAFLSYEKFMNFNMKHYLVPWEELRIGDGYVQTRWTEEHLLPETLAEQRANLPDGGAAPSSMADGGMLAGAVTGSPPVGAIPEETVGFLETEDEEVVAPNLR